jgi:hypothetical protein
MLRVARRLALAGVCSLAACQEPPPLFPPTAPDDIRQACALTQQKCTACHDRDRIVSSHRTMAEWRVTVERMRRIPGSSISLGDGEIILRCLTYSSEP